MQISRRRLSAGELDYELVWLSVSLGLLAMAAFWFTLRLPWPHCLFLAVTGHPCFTCGATRSTIAFLHGDFWTAWKWNPMFFVFLCGLSIFDAYACAVLITRAPRLRIGPFSQFQKRAIRLAAIILLLSNWIYLLSRPAGVF